MECENEALKQQAYSNTPVKRMSEHLAIPSIPSSKKLANGHHDNEELRSNESQSVTPANKFGPEAENALKKFNIEREHVSVDALMKCVVQEIGFSQGKAVAAFTIYKCLLHWKSFEAERTSVFDHLLQMMGSAIENQENNDLMAYWLTNTSTLLFLLQKSLKEAGFTPIWKPPPATSLFGRMTQENNGTEEKVIVAVKQGNLLGIAFHPELTVDTRWHNSFLKMIGEEESTPDDVLSSHGEDFINNQQLINDFPIYQY